MTLSSLLPRGRALRALDLAVVVWTLFWVVMGGAAARQIRSLDQLSQTATQVGSALLQTGQTVQSLSEIPFVGSRVGQAGRQIDTAGLSTLASAQSSRDRVHTLSWMLWIFLAVIPTAPLLLLYAPMRLVAARERHALQRLVDHHGHEPAFRRLLAQRAALATPYQQLLDRNDPLDFRRDSDINDQAHAELTRLGIRDPKDLTT